MLRLFLTTLLLALLAPKASLAETPQPPAVMSAEVYAAGIPVSDYWVSEKLDGVRGHWDGAQLWTRGGHRINTPAEFTANWPATPMDGELWIGRGAFERVSGIVRRQVPNADDWREVHFKVFDLPAHEGPFTERVHAMRDLLAASGIPWLQPVSQFRVADESELQRHFDAVVNAGGEGLMLHHGEAHYRAGRSEDLLKFKPYDDAEARVIGYRPGQGKYTGQMGALEVETPDGIRFALGSGFSDAERADPPPVGAWVTYRYNGFTGNGIPRFARFLRVREGWTPPE
jgi:DNA ligase 1